MFRILLVISLFSTLAFSEEKSKAINSGSIYKSNVSVSPLGLLVGYINVDLDFKINDKWSLGPSASYWSLPEIATTSGSMKVSQLGLGARGNYFFEGTFEQGWYISPMLHYISATAKIGSISATVSTFRAQCVGGFHWAFDPINLSLGGGLATYLGAFKAKVTGSAGGDQEYSIASNGVGIAIDFMLGLNF